MPILASFYAALLVAIVIFSAPYYLKCKDPAWHIALDVLADMSVVVLFVGYWSLDIAQALGRGAVVLFVFSFLWIVASTLHHAAACEQEEFSPALNLHYRRFVLMFEPVLFFPGLWFGGVVAFRSL